MMRDRCLSTAALFLVALAVSGCGRDMKAERRAAEQEAQRQAAEREAQRERRLEAARLGIANLENALVAHRLANGEWPATLEALCLPTPEGKPALLDAKQLLDPWGEPYQYEPQNLSPTTGKPRIYALEPDGTPIANW